MQEKVPNTAETGVSIIPGVRVAVPMGTGMKLEDRLRVKGLAITTEETYVGWYRRHVKYSGMRHPQEMGAREVEAFLTHLAAELNVAAARKANCQATKANCQVICLLDSPCPAQSPRTPHHSNTRHSRTTDKSCAKSAESRR